MKKVLVLLITVMLVPAYLLAGVYGKISGTVTDASTGEPLVGANVVVLGTSLGASSDSNGKYYVLNVPAGSYDVRANYIGFKSTTVENIAVSIDHTTMLDFSMETAAVEGETVVIVAEKPLVNLSATNAVRTVDAEVIANIATRNVEEIYAINAGIVLQNDEVFIRGGRSDETDFQLEGASTVAVMGADLGTNSITDNPGLARDNTVNTIAEALEEVNVLSGGFSAEMGGAASGIIQQVLKTGTDKLHASVQYETDGMAESFGETYSYGYSDVTATISGPVGNIRYFLAVQKNSSDDYAPQFFTGNDFGYLKDSGEDGGSAGDSALVKWDDGKVSGRSDDRTTINGTLQFDFNPLILRVALANTNRERRLNPFPMLYLFNQQRLPQRDDLNRLITTKASFFLSENTLINASVSMYKYQYTTYDPSFTKDGKFDLLEIIDYGNGALVDSTIEGSEFLDDFTQPAPYNFHGFEFQRPGAIVTGYRNREQSYIEFAGGFQTQKGNHEIRAGGSYQTWVVRNYLITGGKRGAISRINSRFYENPGLRDDFAAGTDTAAARILRLDGVRNFGYDEFGKEINDNNNVDDAKRPVFSSVYFNDKIEAGDIIINGGVRLDRFELDTWHIANLDSPDYDSGGESVYADGLSESDVEVVIQPRLGLAFPISDRAVFHLQFGKFAQAPDMADAYASRSRMASIFGGQNFINDPIGFDLKPIKSTQYEIGFNYQFSPSAAFDITAFYKNTEGQLTISQQRVAPGLTAKDFNMYVNGDFAVIRGLEFTVRTRRANRIQTLFNYTLSDARGTNAFPNSRVSSVERRIEPPEYITPLLFEQKHRGSLNFDYRFIGEDKGPGGLLASSGINLLFNFNSGHRFTKASGGMGQRRPDIGALLTENDPRNRVPTEPIGNSATPWVFTTDLKLDKAISLGNVEMSVYLYVSNLFNRRNILNVYNRSGNAYDDGFLSDPELSQKVVEGLDDTTGEGFVDLYRAINIDNRQHWIRDTGYDLFSTPREILVGVKVNL